MTDGNTSIWGLLYRYASGQPLNGSGGYRYLSPGAGRWPGWKRQAYRLGLPALTLLTAVRPRDGLALLALAVILIGWRGRRTMAQRRFHREYIAPTLEAIRTPLGLALGVKLHVDPSLGNLTPRLAKPLSPAEVATRRWYGEHVEPVLRWTPERAQRGLWAVQLWVRPATSKLEVFRRPGEQVGPRIELNIKTPYLTSEQRLLISSIINSKIPVADLVESWNQVGVEVMARWIVRKRPPASCGYAQVLEHIDRLKEWEFYLGQGVGDKPIILSLQDDSPHIAISAGTGAGKSVLAQLLAAQVLRRGGRVIILDRKGSHRWALGMPGVDYCTKPHQMHDALVKHAGVADQRNDDALHEEEGWDPGPRVLVICEELNATIGQLVNYWAEVREKSDPKKSPAVAALADLLFMGRSAKYNVIAIAQMLTARAIGGPEARENFGVRLLARYTTNAWKMLVPEAAMPRSSRTRGRWQLVVGGVATEVQVAFLTAAEVRALAQPAESPDSALSSDVTSNGNKMTLRQASDNGVIPWGYDAAKMRLHRKDEAAPKPCGKDGKAFLYDRAELERWASSGKR
ncbi:DUF87 domain-containing protein [Actinoplanes sp. Pm04-4]|uniref:DUF87 domain-containing protein n=1 Tax=Paractinoplanes pyxinae TaxID=2997416 RepID=A0ABT4B4G8_9ACTN|nr:DUF87 domain-containing protein [Actinoplanes pyxinae]MCY1141397.1 DUF87 domain-containing protein [Actinoplanes pyxinae]